MRLRFPLRAADGDAPPAGTGAAEPPKPAEPPKAEPPKPAQVDTKAIEAEARKALLSKLGVESEEDVAKILKAHKEAEKEKLSATERAAKELEEEKQAKAKLAAKLEEAQAEIKSAKTQRDLLAKGVKPEWLEVAEFLFGKAKDAKFDEWIESQKKEKPELFTAPPSAPAASPASTTPGVPPAVGTPSVQGSKKVDLMLMTDEERRAHLNGPNAVIKPFQKTFS